MDFDIFETDAFGIPLMEMANAIQKYTGLPGVVYFCTKGEVQNTQAHALGRVKWRHQGAEASVSIKTQKDGTRRLDGNARMARELERFVKHNEAILWQYWNTPRDEADSAETMKLFKPV